MDQENGSLNGQLVLVLDGPTPRQLVIGLITFSTEFAAGLFPTLSAEFGESREMSATSLGNGAKLGSVNLTRTPPGDRVREARLARGMTIEALAREADVSPRTIQRYEAGKKPNPAFLARLCSPLTVTLGWLLGDEKEPEHGNDRSKDHEG